MTPIRPLHRGWLTSPAGFDSDYTCMGEAVHRAKKRAFIAGPTVSGKVPKNWRQAAEVGIDAILTDYPLDLRTTFRKNAATK